MWCCFLPRLKPVYERRVQISFPARANFRLRTRLCNLDQPKAKYNYLCVLSASPEYVDKNTDVRVLRNVLPTCKSYIADSSERLVE